MATLQIRSATLLGGTSYINLQFTVVDNGVTISDQYFNFYANDLSVIYDLEAPNIAVLHLGNQHTFTMSNADYNVITFNGAVQADVVTAVQTIIGDVAPYSS